tara:strand:+ start:1852 stop:2187 length:336 start_codon:yes stop_codon:yes gene_type:complete
MKIKRSQLRRLINEELARVLNEAAGEALPSGVQKKLVSLMRQMLETGSGRFQASFSVEPGERLASVTDVVVDESTTHPASADLEKFLTSARARMTLNDVPEVGQYYVTVVA